MAYSRGTNANIIVGAAALFVTKDAKTLTSANIPVFVSGESYKESLTLRTTGYNDTFRNVGYTNNGVELSFQPDFGEVMVDQLLDVARIYKQGMKVNLKTTLAEATLENLLLAIAGKASDSGTWTESVTLSGLTSTATAAITATATGSYLNVTSGDLGDYPVERGLIAVGPGLGSLDGADTPATATDQAERVYIAYRAISIESVTASAKRDAASTFEVSFRLLPDNAGNYGKIVDRTY